MIRNSIRVKRLGLVPYAEAYKIQQQHVADVVKRRPRGQTLLLLEHPPVYTVGLRSAAYSDAEAQRLKSLGADFVKTNRGGLITFHGAGQLVAYPILDLNAFAAADPTASTAKNLSVGGVKWYVAQLEAALIATCYEAGVKDASAPGFPLTGVWTGGRKLASIGIHSRDGVTSHGAALNCDVDLAWFRHVAPCGMDGSAMTSLSKELNSRLDVATAMRLFETAFAECLQCDLTYEHHP